MSARKNKILPLVLTLAVLLLLLPLLTLPASAASGGNVAVAGLTAFDPTEDKGDLFGDGKAVYHYDIENDRGILTLTGFDDSGAKTHPYLDKVWNGSNGETTTALFSVLVTGRTPVYVCVTGDTYLKYGISVEKGMVTFDDAKVTFGEDITCGAVVHDGNVAVYDSTLTMEGAGYIHATRPDSSVSAFLYGYDITVDHSTVTCDINNMTDHCYSDGFLYAERNLLLNDSTLTLKTNRSAFLHAFESYTGLLQATGCKITLDRPQICFAAYGAEGVGTDDLQGVGSVSFDGTTVKAENCSAFAICSGFVSASSKITAETLSQGIRSEGTAETYVIFRDSKVSLTCTNKDDPEAATFGLLAKGGAVVMADSRLSFDGYGCGVCIYGQAQLALEKKVRLDIKADVTALMIASQIDESFNPTVDYRASGAALRTTEIPGSVPADGVGRYASSFVRGSTAFAFTAEDPKTVDSIWQLILACRGDTVMKNLKLRTEGAYLKPWAVILIVVGGVAAVSVGGWFLWKYFRRKKTGNKAKSV